MKENKSIREKVSKAIGSVAQFAQPTASNPKTDPLVDAITKSEMNIAQEENIAQKVAKYHKMKVLSDKLDKEMKKLNNEIKAEFKDEVAIDKPFKERFGSFLLHIYASGGKEVETESIDEEAFEKAHPRIAKNYQRALEVRQQFVKVEKHTTKVVVSMKISHDGNPYTMDDVLNNL